MNSSDWASPFLSFDLTKYLLRNLKDKIPNLLIIRYQKEFFFNILKPPPGVKIIEWWMTVCQITAEIFGLRSASQLLLLNLGKSLYNKFNTRETGIFPMFQDLNDELKNFGNGKKGSHVHRDHISRIQMKFDAINMVLGHSLNVEEGLPFEELLLHPVCLELIGINSVEIQTWIVSLIMAWISSYRMANAHFGKLRHVIIYDECAHTYGK